MSSITVTLGLRFDKLKQVDVAIRLAIKHKHTNTRLKNEIERIEILLKRFIKLLGQFG